MVTPFAPYINLRLRYDRPTEALTDLREGVRTASEVVVIDAFARNAMKGGVDAIRELDMGGLLIGQTYIGGYLVRHALLPEGSNWLDSGTSWDWNTSGLRPTSLKAGEKLQAFWGNLSSLPQLGDGSLGVATLTRLAQPFSTGGIGHFLRQRLGESFTAVYTETR